MLGNRNFPTTSDLGPLAALAALAAAGETTSAGDLKEESIAAEVDDVPKRTNRITNRAPSERRPDRNRKGRAADNSKEDKIPPHGRREEG